MPILITGCARSGTSLTTGILRACGASLGPVNSLNEHMAVREKLCKPYLASIGCDPLGQDPLPRIEDLKPDPKWREKVVRAIGEPEPWAYKGAKMCLMWTVWADAFPEAKWVIVRRDWDRIVESCLRTSFMRAYKTREGWGRWVDTHIQRFEEMKQNLDCIEVWPDMGPGTYREMVEFCGLTFDRGAVERQIRPGQWHG